MKIKVYRQAGDKEYSDVLVDPLCCTQSAGKAKGLCFLYNNIDKLVYEIETIFSIVIKPNDWVFISDSSIGESFYARVSNVKITGNRADSALTISQLLTIERYIE